MHYIRFCRREDLGPSSIGSCTVQDFHKDPLRAGDVMLIAKRWLADTSPMSIVALVPEQRCLDMQRDMMQPTGSAPRRVISAKVRQNISTYVPRIVKSGELPPDAAAYLLGWSQCTLPRKSKPVYYALLDYRWQGSGGRRPVPAAQWQPPRRNRRINLAPDLSHSDTESDNDDDALPIDMD